MSQAKEVLALVHLAFLSLGFIKLMIGGKRSWNLVVTLTQYVRVFLKSVVT